MSSPRLSLRLFAAASILAAAVSTAVAQAQHGKPNIVVIWGDDIGRDNLSVFTHGMMGYRTPNIDRIAREGMLFKILTRIKVAPPGARRSLLGNRHSELV